MTRYKSAVQKRNAAVLLRKPGRLASQYASMKLAKIGTILSHFSAIWIMLFLSLLLFQRIGYNMFHALGLCLCVIKKQ